MKSPKPPNPSVFRSLRCACCLLTLGWLAGCENSPPIEMAAAPSPAKEKWVTYQADLEPNAPSLRQAQEKTSEDWSFHPSVFSPQGDGTAPSAQLNSAPQDSRPPILAVQLQDSVARGIPIGLFSNQTLLMQNDGSILRIPKAAIVKQTILKDRFTPMERAELSQHLRSEFGRSYLIKSEGPYLVVARPEHMDVWLQRFRSLWFSFRLYCSTHQIATRDIEFPLVAVVFGSHAEFLHYANTTHVKLPKDCAGFYFSDTNRIALFESVEMSVKETQTIICHEATHQIAFNVGLHQREANLPLWVVEGLASVFEAPMLTGLQSRGDKSLWAASRRTDWQRLAKSPATIQRLVSDLIQNDKAFQQEPQNAYCVSWAMTLYLSQRRSQQYGPFLQRCGSREPYQEYTQAQRARDFESAFGTDTRVLANKILNYLADLD